MAYSIEYLTYLKSKKWQQIRQLKLKLAKYRCAYNKRRNCQGYLQVHHLHYRNLGNERLGDLMVLCKYHHAKVHGKEYINLPPQIMLRTLAEMEHNLKIAREKLNNASNY